jgi:adenylate cyclase
MRKLVIASGGIGLIAAVIFLALWHGGLLEGLEGATWNWRVRAFAPRTPPHPQIKMILLDQATLAWGQKENGWSWPWPRTVYTPIIDFCKRGGAKTIAFDVLFTEPSSYEAADDQALGDAIKRTPGFIGAVFTTSQPGAGTNWPANAPRTGPEFVALDQWRTQNRARQVDVPQAVFPIPEVTTNATMLANVSEKADPDDLFRRATQFRVFQGKAVPSLGLASFLVAEQRAGRAVSVRFDHNSLQIGDRGIPIDDRGRAILRFCGKNGTHESFSAAAVIQSELRLQAGEKPTLDPAVFTNAYVFFAYSAPGLLDLHPSPINHAYPGVEIHATSLDNLLTNAFLKQPPASMVTGAVLLLGLLSGSLVSVCRKAWQSVLVFLVLLPIPVLAGFAAYPAGWWWPMVVAEGAVAAALTGGVLLSYATEGRQKAFLKRAFKHYLGAEVIDQIIADPSRLQLGGEKRELTIFFSDIEKFSTFSEKLDSRTLTHLLNEYLSDMTDIILEEGGYLDKYIGDAIVAFWNAPATQADHAVRACRTVLRCQRRLAERRQHYEKQTGVIIKARVGMHTGEVTVGNMGSRDRFNYTILGDAANLASRLEGANKAFGTYTLISETTWTQTNGQFIGRELGRLRVLGREQPVRVYEILGLAGESLPNFVADFEAGFKLCLEAKWSNALAHFELYPSDPPCVKYAAFCQSQLKNDARTWDGIWHLTEK